MKNNLTLLTITLAMFWWNNFTNAQCNIVSGASGSIHDITNTTSVNYTATVSGAASFANLGASTACGLTFPGISAPWSGNNNSLGTVIYTFSAPITTLKIFIAYVGTTGQSNPESFTFTTNGALPSLTVDAGTCTAWTVVGNQITSPSVVNSLNSIVTVFSAIPFTTLNIVSGTNSSVNGGSSYGLCDASLVTTIKDLRTNPNLIAVYPNPNSGIFKIENKTTNKINLEIYNLLGEKIFTSANFEQQTSNEVDLSDFRKGNYFGKVYDGEKVCTKTILIQ